MIHYLDPRECSLTLGVVTDLYGVPYTSDDCTGRWVCGSINRPFMFRTLFEDLRKEKRLRSYLPLTLNYTVPLRLDILTNNTGHIYLLEIRCSPPLRRGHRSSCWNGSLERIFFHNFTILLLKVFKDESVVVGSS